MGSEGGPNECKKNSGHRFAVVIPVYNHGITVKAVVVEAVKLGFPVIIVDDGSTDITPYQLKGLPGIRVITHEQNLGKGAALMTGFKIATEMADFAVTMDADGQHFPNDALAMIAAVPIGKKPLVTGYRKQMENERVPWTSRMGRRFSNMWILASGGPGIRDSQSGFRIYPLPETLNLKTRARRYQFEVEVLVKAHRNKIEVIEVPIRVEYPFDRVSHFRPFIDFLRNSATFSRLIFRRIVGLV
ncbi:glycosyltransferase family 2 protein [uncultured Desulfobacter sp.]|uniref:glycosyltransferase family 2 protein n=1 Tax=uncultured Desulfobacter sp. TaxID=240139 RepID=UPI0029F4D4F5|nr:glycosyltransferase family 2 protein [uncultured Desulfobacter sp.]